MEFNRIDWKQEFKILYQIWLFRADQKTEMAAMAYDFDFTSEPLNHIDEISQEASTLTILFLFDCFFFSGVFENQRLFPQPIHQQR